MSDFAVTGADDMLHLSKALKNAGRTQLRKDLNKGLRQGAKPLIPLTRAAARATLPSSGGLAALVARTPQRVQVRTGAQPGVRLVVGKNRSGARGANRGVVRHPVFGNREVWAETPVPEGWFDDTVRDNIGKVRPALEQALHETAQRVIDEAR